MFSCYKAVTLPRKPIPYDKFETQIEHNFSIYSRNTVNGATKFMIRVLPSFIANWIRDSLKIVPYNSHSSKFFKSHRSGIYRSELFTYSYQEQEARNFYAGFDDVSNRSKYLLELTRMAYRRHGMNYFLTHTRNVIYLI